MNNIKITLGSLLLFVSLSQVMQSCGLGCGCGSIVQDYVMVTVDYENTQGEDLLIPAVKGSFKEEDIKVYDLLSGKKRKRAEDVINPTWHIRKYISADGTQHAGALYVRVNRLANERVKTMYVQLSDHDTDTITYTLDDKTEIKEVWYNGELSEYAPGENRNMFRIVKKPVLVK